VGTVLFEQAKEPNKSTIWNQYTLVHHDVLMVKMGSI